MATRSNVSAAARTLLAMLAVLILLAATEAMRTKPLIISYYLQQELGNTELQIVPAARQPVNGTSSGFGQVMVYEFVMTATQDPASNVMGFHRGTVVAVNNTAAGTVFVVNNVVHYDYKGVRGTFVQQGEAVFSSPSWELVITGGTGAFRNAYGYNLGSPVTLYRTSSGLTHVITHYQAHISFDH